MEEMELRNRHHAAVLVAVVVVPILHSTSGTFGRVEKDYD